MAEESETDAIPKSESSAIKDGENSSSNSTPRSKRNNMSTSEIMFEGQWEEDDMVALSGVAGQSFQKIHTAADTDEDLNTRRRLEVELANDDMLDMDISESDLDGVMTPEELLTPDDIASSVDSPQHNSGIDLEWDNDTPVLQPTEETVSPQPVHGSTWRTVVIGDKNYKLDLSAITPYRQVLSHGGYYGEGLNAIVVFSACFLPDCNEKDYRYIMDNLFLYVVSTLELLVAEDYMIIFFNSGCRRRNLPPVNWLKKCYQMIHRRLRKNLKQLIVVHPSWYIRLLIGFFRPFISSKFSKKLQLVSNLHKLADLVPLDSVVVPDAVQLSDIKLQQKFKKDPSVVNISSGPSEQSSPGEFPR
uniref:BCL2/adenovirus E1B 19 kDa protein-interacting protein 2-like n=1 Tax=Phallusia mammillata TaxID=59560 RepID=A0A6F9D890_9ASCI|nr:BCL2/adenovirus E1B 19 kDa protein-interacting protein 2-like [Phallusia mammillata]